MVFDNKQRDAVVAEYRLRRKEVTQPDFCRAFTERTGIQLSTRALRKWLADRGGSEDGAVVDHAREILSQVLAELRGAEERVAALLDQLDGDPAPGDGEPAPVDLADVTARTGADEVGVDAAEEGVPGASRARPGADKVQVMASEVQVAGAEAVPPDAGAVRRVADQPSQEAEGPVASPATRKVFVWDLGDDDDE